MSEEGKRAAAEIAARLKELTEQRDALREAVEGLLPHLECADFKGADPLTAIEEARAALAMVTP